MSTTNQSRPNPTINWKRIPDGTKVRHRHAGQEGFIDGLTELVTGSGRNPDGKTQYRVNIGAPSRQLMIEDDLCILLDQDNLVIMMRQKAPYRLTVTKQLQASFTDDRFIKSA